MELYPDWDFRENISIQPCICKADCGNYVLSIKGHKAHVFDAPKKEMINIATLDIDDLYDLFANVDFALSVESKRDELENSFNKTIKKSKKTNHKNKEEN